MRSKATLPGQTCLIDHPKLEQEQQSKDMTDHDDAMIDSNFTAILELHKAPWTGLILFSHLTQRGFSEHSIRECADVSIIFEAFLKCNHRFMLEL